MKKIIVLCLAFILITTLAFADVTVKVISYEKEISNDGTAKIKVTFECKLDDVKVKSNYPDGNWRLRYLYNRYSEEAVLKDTREHAEVIIKHYIEKNRQTILNKTEEVVDAILVAPKNPIEYTVKDVTIPDLNLMLEAKE